MLESELKKLTNQIETLNVNIAKLISVQESQPVSVSVDPTPGPVNVEPFPEFTPEVRGSSPDKVIPDEVEAAEVPEKPNMPSMEPPGQTYGHSTREDIPENKPSGMMPPGMVSSGEAMLPPGMSPQQHVPPTAALEQQDNAPMGNIQSYAVRRAAEISAQLGTSQNVENLMAQYGIVDLSKETDDKLKYFLDILETTFSTHWMPTRR